MTNRRVTLTALTVCLLIGGAFTAVRGEEKPAKVPTSHYVDFAKHIEMDVPEAWTRKFSEDASMYFVFTTNGKSTADAQAPELTIMIASDDSTKSVATFTPAVKKKAMATGTDVKFEKEQDKKVDGETAVAFSGVGKTKAGAAKVAYVVTVHGGMGYAISLAGDPATFDGEMKSAQAVIDSIKWVK